MENYIVSARKYRPATFDTVVGQSALTTTLKNAIASGHLAHAYLFCGPRGVGKTTCARIFAKTINCLSPKPNGEACNECESCRAFNEQRSFNIHELDAASNNSVDDIRQLIDQVRIPPQVGKYKVFIIDEVHMLSTAAFNAFLKTLEEPPQHAIFILATTEKHKILPTILSRCQIYDFNRMSVSDIVHHLENVAEKEGISAEPAALNVIAQKADGGMRDALSIFDQVVSFCGGNVTYQRTIDNLNVLDYDYYFKLTDYFLEGKVPEIMLTLNEILNKGFDGKHFINGLSGHFRNLLMAHDPQTTELMDAGDDVKTRYQSQAQKCKTKFLYRAMKLCSDCDLNYRQSSNKRLLVEITLIQVAQAVQDEGDGSSAGRSPEKKLKPLFKQQAGEAGAESAKRPAVNQTPQADGSAAPNGVPVAGAPHTRPIAPVQQKVTTRRELGFSIRQMEAEAMKASEAPTVTASSASGVQTKTAQMRDDVPVDQRGVMITWKEFATTLPQEERAMANRMNNIEPTLLNAETFEVLADNPTVEDMLRKYAPRIEEYMRGRLGNSKIRMSVRIREPEEKKRAYSKVEQFTMMCGQNPALLKLKEEFGLELA